LSSLSTPESGEVKALTIDLGDLKTIGPCVSAFLAQSSRLDVLFNNAGMGGSTPPGSLNAQGQDLVFGINCLGPFLLTKLLLPILRQTAKTSPPASVRVLFTGSGLVDMKAPTGGVSLHELQPGKGSKDPVLTYAASKAGNWLLASEFDKRVRGDGVVCLVQNPGNLNTSGYDGVNWLTMLFVKPLLHEPKFGAYTGLWTALSTDVKVSDGGRYVLPWGKWHVSPQRFQV
jgi:NAD(P)-dependent dehydrogenase (short-subunit alcohol dehydrogenase family)